MYVSLVAYPRFPLQWKKVDAEGKALELEGTFTFKDLYYRTLEKCIIVAGI